jgi:hypothetical protein
VRGDLTGLPGISEKRMFGGLAFMLNGNMLCGVHSGGGMFRVGKANEAVALAIEGVAPMGLTGRRMGGFVDTGDEVLADDARRAQLMALTLSFARSLPPK